MGMNRRQVFSNSAKALFAGLATPYLLDPADPANALLMKFPIDEHNTQPLKNRYHFMRAGTSELEVEGIYSTNPLFLTNRENAMSDKGCQSVKGAISTLKKNSNSPTVIYHSLAANGMDTGDLLARELRLGRDRLLPEFTYLDQRGIGLWDSSEEELVRPAVWAMDKLEAGKEGFGGRPPANTDGTPNDSLHDQFTRLRQFLSLQETRSSGETILVIFPDGTGPALLSCMIAGIPYSEVHALEYQPGELRTFITRASVEEMYETRKDDPAYLAAIEDGKEKLKELREMSANDFTVSFKDSKANEKDAEESRIAYEKQQALNAERRKADEERRKAMQEKIRLSKENVRVKEEQRKKELLAVKEKKEQKLREDREIAIKKKAEQQSAYVEVKQKQAEAARAKKQKYVDSLAASNAAAKEKQAAKKTASEPSESSSPFGLSVPVLATAAFGAIGAVLLSGSEDEDENINYSSVTTTKDGSDGGANTAKTASISSAVQEVTPKIQTAASVTSNKEEELKNEKPELGPIHSVVTVNNSATEAKPISKAVQEETPETQTTPQTSDKQEEQKKETQKLEHSVDTEGAAKTPSIPAPVQYKSPETKAKTPVATNSDWRRSRKAPSWKRSRKEDVGAVDDSSNKKEEEFTAKLQAAEQDMKDALIEAADVVKKKKQEQHPQSPPKKKSSLFDNDPPVIITKTKTKETNHIYEDDEDDSDWLRVLSEIRDEQEDDEDDDYDMVDYASLLDDAQS